MKTIGLIGGMSWESTVTYYQLLNRAIKQQLGGLHSAKIVLVSVDFAEIEQLQHRGDWQTAGRLLAEAAIALQSAGADFFIICTNTMHKVADIVCQAVAIPLLHIADATALDLQSRHINTVGLLGTRFTMQENFYKNRLTERFGIKVMVPDAKQQDTIHQTIYQELCQGIILPESAQVFLQTIDTLVAQGAQAIILGCTEIGLLITQDMTTIPLFDTTHIHATKAAERALSSD